jgi:hemoglobin-like flavoprotein
MKKILIILTLVFVVAVPAYAAVEKAETGNFGAQVKTFMNRVFQGENEEIKDIGNAAPSAQLQQRRVENNTTNTEASPETSSGAIRERSLDREVTLPYCESADIDKHYTLASEYVEESVSSQYSVSMESHRQVGPCNQGNIAWTAFDIVDEENNIVGEAIVNGDTEEVSFVNIDDVNSLTNPSNTRSDEAKNTGIGNRVKSFIDRTILNKNTTSSLRGPVGPGEFSPADKAQVPEEVREMLNQKREEVRNRIQENYEEVQSIRAEVRERVENKKVEIAERLQQIRNEQKKEIAQRVYKNLFDVREKVLERFNKTLDRLNIVLTNINTRADKIEADGSNVDDVREIVQNATHQIEETRDAVKEILAKEYDVTITTEEELGQNFTNFRNELKNDLENVRSMVRNANELTRSAAERLAQVIGSE